MKGKSDLNHFIADVYGKGYVPRLLLTLLFALLASSAQSVLTFSLGSIIDATNQGLQTVMNLIVLISVTVIVYTTSETIFGLLSGRLANRFLLKLREKLALKISNSDYSELEKYQDGDILSRTINDTEGFRNWLMSLCKAGYLPAKLFASLGIAFMINWKLMLTLVPVVPLVLYSYLRISKKLYGLHTAEKEMLSTSTSFLNTALNFILIIKSFCLENSFTKKNRVILDDVTSKIMGKNLHEHIMELYGNCVGHINFALLFILGAYFILGGEMKIGQILVLVLNLDLIGEGLTIIQTMPTSYQGAKASMQRVSEILQLPDENNGGILSVSDNCKQSEPIYQLRDVNFTYDNVAVLKHINISFHKGEKIAIIGMSGSGKSTLFKLLCGLYQPTNGKIEYLGQDMSLLSIRDLRSELTVVPQESFIFNDTIRNNIKIVSPQTTDEEMYEACKAAKIYNYIVSLKSDYHTMLKNGSKGMSKGEMQRFNLARAFLKNSSVFLLDEPTSAQDIHIHNAIMDYIMDNLEYKTIIMIIHSLNHAERFDKIMVMKNGEIVGFGHHSQLCLECPAYRMIQGVSENIEHEGGVFACVE